MTKYNITIDDPSPRISYTPASSWRPATTENDSLLGQYNNATASTSQVVGGTMSFTFTGTGIWVYGAKRDNHGSYTARVDNLTTTLNGFNSPNIFQQLMFGLGGLAMGPHEISFVNLGPVGADPSWVWFDVDTVVWETEFEGPGGPIDAQVSEDVFDDTHPRFQYLPSTSAWQQATNVNGTLNGTLSTTSSTGAVAQFTFDGDAIALYGSMGNGNGNFTASVDGKFTSHASGFYSIPVTQQMLYYAEGLGAGSHTLKIANTPVGSSGALSVDYVRTWTAKGGSGGSTSTPTHTPKSSTPIGGIIGAVLAGLLFIIALVALFFWYRRRTPQGKTYPGAPDPFLIDEFPAASHPPSHAQTELYYANNQRILAPSSYASNQVQGASNGGPSTISEQSHRNPELTSIKSGHSLRSDLSAITTTGLIRSRSDATDTQESASTNNYRSPNSSNQSQRRRDPRSPASTYTQSTFDIYSGYTDSSSATASIYYSSPSASTINPYQYPTEPVPSLNPKALESRGATIPRNTQAPTHMTADEIRRQRLVVAGREQDFGPVEIAEGEAGPSILPPDYAQAVQPWESRANELQRERELVGRSS